MKNTTPRSIAARLVLVGTVAASAAAFVPGVAGAAGDKLGCVGKTITATGHDQVLQGTACSDTFKILQFSGVTVHAGGGNDTVYAGFGSEASKPYLYLGDGHDRVVNNNDRSVWVSAGAGNDTIESSSGYDAIYGGTGTDKALNLTPGDFYDSIELYW